MLRRYEAMMKHYHLLSSIHPSLSECHIGQKLGPGTIYHGSPLLGWRTLQTVKTSLRSRFLTGGCDDGLTISGHVDSKTNHRFPHNFSNFFLWKKNSDTLSGGHNQVSNA